MAYQQNNNVSHRGSHLLPMIPISTKSVVVFNPPSIPEETVPINDDAVPASTTSTEVQKCINPEATKTLNSKYTRGNNVLSGLTHECGVFGAIACGDWPTSVRRRNPSFSYFQELLNLLPLPDRCIPDHLPWPGGPAAPWSGVSGHCHQRAHEPEEL